MSIRNYLFFCLLPLCFFCFLSSCSTYKNIAYFTDFSDTVKHTTVQTVPFKSPVIAPDDLLTISIQTIDPDINALLNNGNTPSAIYCDNTSSVLIVTTTRIK